MEVFLERHSSEGLVSITTDRARNVGSVEWTELLVQQGRPNFFSTSLASLNPFAG